MIKQFAIGVLVLAALFAFAIDNFLPSSTQPPPAGEAQMAESAPAPQAPPPANQWFAKGPSAPVEFGTPTASADPMLRPGQPAGATSNYIQRPGQVDPRSYTPGPLGMGSNPARPPVSRGPATPQAKAALEQLRIANQNRARDPGSSIPITDAAR